MPPGHLYLMQADGSNMRQICFDQDLDLHPVVLSNGQLLYNRWDYTGINHIYLRQLMAMNPDGSGQRAVMGSNTWFPNAWGLHDIHGNAAKWTASPYRPYAADRQGSSTGSDALKYVLQGGAFCEPPRRCRSGFRTAYPPWQRVYQAGFRVACLADTIPGARQLRRAAIDSRKLTAPRIAQTGSAQPWYIRAPGNPRSTAR
jgi:hypothetical protein